MPTDSARMMNGHKNNHRWNFSMGMVHAVFFSGATSFVHPDTVIPLFLSTLTSSSIIIGIASMIRGTLGGLGSVIPQLFVAAHLHNVTRRKPFLVKTLVVRAACFFLLGLITLLLYDRSPSLLIVSGLALSFIFTITGGVASVPFYPGAKSVSIKCFCVCHQKNCGLSISRSRERSAYHLYYTRLRERSCFDGPTAMVFF